MPIHHSGGFVQQEEKVIRTRCASISTAERPALAILNNIPSSCSWQEPWGGWPGAWAHGRSVAPAWSQGRSCTAREILGLVSGAGSTVKRWRLQMACLWHMQPRWRCHGGKAARGEVPRQIPISQT